MPVVFVFKEFCNGFLYFLVKLRIFFEGVKENGVNVGKNPNNSNGRMFFLVHDMEGEGNEQLRKNFQDIFWLEIFG